MDGLRSKGKDVLEELRFGDFDKDLARVEIHKYERRDAEIHSSIIHRDDLSNAFTFSPQAGSNEARSADLVLVYLEQTETWQMEISRDSYEMLFSQCGLDPFVLYLMAHKIHGFHCLDIAITERVGWASSAHDNGLQKNNESLYGNLDSNMNPTTYFLYVSGQYMLAWTFYPETNSTRAMMIQFVTYSRELVHKKFEIEMERHISLISHPLFLAFIQGIHLTDMIHHNILMAEGTIFHIESQTNYSPWNDRIPSLSRRQQQPVDDGEMLAYLTRQVSGDLALLALDTRYNAIAKLVLTSVLEARPQPSSSADSEEGFNLKSMQKAARVLNATTGTHESTIRLLESRGKTQLSVLFNLIAQRDATVNIELAKDSRTIAFAAQHDSDSMKTIAIMTMAFLPATFFAAFFSMPLLEWNGGKMIQTRFWIFWAFAIPITALVFVLWYVISKRHAIHKRIENKRQRAKLAWRTRSYPSRKNQSDDDQSCPADFRSDDQDDEAVSDYNIPWTRKELKKRRAWKPQNPGIVTETENVLDQA